MIALTKWDEDYTATLMARKNLNEEHFDMTERLPEFALDMKRQPVFKTPLFYESETSAGFYRRNFAGEGMIRTTTHFARTLFINCRCRKCSLAGFPLSTGGAARDLLRGQRHL
jgi:hypothetical protein